jgi:hypothetical protein
MVLLYQSNEEDNIILFPILSERLGDRAFNKVVATLPLDLLNRHLDFVGLGILEFVQVGLVASQAGVEDDASLRTVDSNLLVRIDAEHGSPGAMKEHTLGPHGLLKGDDAGNN